MYNDTLILSLQNSSPINVVFIDIDGVLNNRTSTYLSDHGFYPPKNKKSMTMDVGCVKLFECLIEETNSYFCVCSSWRKPPSSHQTWQDSNQEIFHAMEWAGYSNSISRCIGITPRKSPLDEDFETRGDEIQYWLDNLNLMVNHYIIIDDQPKGIDWHPNVISPEPFVGLSVKNVLFAKQILFSSYPKLEESFEL